MVFEPHPNKAHGHPQWYVQSAGNKKPIAVILFSESRQRFVMTDIHELRAKLGSWELREIAQFMELRTFIWMQTIINPEDTDDET